PAQSTEGRSAKTRGSIEPGESGRATDSAEICDVKISCTAAKTATATDFGDSGSMEAVEEYGERGRNRTYNLLIKSQLLCQLSYAPSLTLPLMPVDVASFGGRRIGRTYPRTVQTV